MSDSRFAGWCVTLLLCVTALAQAQDAPEEPVLARVRRQSQRCLAIVETAMARDFLAACQGLPSIETRVLYRDREKKHYYTAQTVQALDAARRSALEEITLDEAYYYTTRYGTPLAYCRPLDLAAGAGLPRLEGRRILDFGYGAIGHLRMMASLGADAVGVEVDPLLAALYSYPGDQGAVRGNADVPGKLTLIHGHWPAEPPAVQAVGEGYDLVLSKNVLKRGYIHPERPVDEHLLVHLGVDDRTFCQHVHRILKPGGLFLIYNLSPKQNPPDQPYIPWADGRCPFPRELLESTGFEVLAFDEDDTPAARTMARTLEWDMSVDDDLFGHYTLLRRPR